jgi:hypothetical protein
MKCYQLVKESSELMADTRNGLKDHGSHWATFVVSDESIDRDHDQMRVEGISPQSWAAAGAPWYFGHESSQLPIGSSINPQTGRLAFWLDGSRALATCYFDMQDPEVKKIWHKVAVAKILRSCSIAFIPLEYEPLSTKSSYQEAGSVAGFRTTGHYFHSCELTEISLVGLGANRQALLQGMSKQFIKSYSESLNRWCPPNGCGPDHDEMLAQQLLLQSMAELSLWLTKAQVEQIRSEAEARGLLPPRTQKIGLVNRRPPRPKDTGPEPYRPRAPEKKEPFTTDAADSQQTGERLLVDEGNVPAKGGCCKGDDDECVCDEEEKMINQADAESGGRPPRGVLAADIDPDTLEIMGRYGEDGPEELQAILAQALRAQQQGHGRESLARSDEDLRAQLARYRYPSETFGGGIDAMEAEREDSTHGNSSGTGNRRAPAHPEDRGRYGY